jgi:hypothetical protein
VRFLVVWTGVVEADGPTSAALKAKADVRYAATVAGGWEPSDVIPLLDDEEVSP